MSRVSVQIGGSAMAGTTPSSRVAANSAGVKTVLTGISMVLAFLKRIIVPISVGAMPMMGSRYSGYNP
jgi:hypothetical protein